MSHIRTQDECFATCIEDGTCIVADFETDQKMCYLHDGYPPYINSPGYSIVYRFETCPSGKISVFVCVFHCRLTY